MWSSVLAFISVCCHKKKKKWKVVFTPLFIFPVSGCCCPMWSWGRRRCADNVSDTQVPEHCSLTELSFSSLTPSVFVVSVSVYFLALQGININSIQSDWIACTENSLIRPSTTPMMHRIQCILFLTPNICRLESQRCCCRVGAVAEKRSR